MGGEKHGLDPATAVGDIGDPQGSAGPSSVNGNFKSLKNAFETFLTANSAPNLQGNAVFGEQVVKEWKELSSRLHLGSKLEERASVLAFVVRQCLLLLGPGKITGYRVLLWIIGVLRHVCMDDNTGYGPIHRNCFVFYGECLAAMDIFMARVAWLCSMRLTRGGAPEYDAMSAKQIRREMEQVAFCMARCWSAIRSECGTPIVSSTTLEGNLRLLASKVDKADSLDVEPTVVEFCNMGLEYIARLSSNMLEGMMTTAKLLVDKAASERKFEECEVLMKLLKGGNREKSLKSLQDIFVRVQEKHISTMKSAGLQKLPDTDPSKQSPGRNKVDDKPKKGLGSGIWSTKFKALAAEMLSAGHEELFSAMWLSDIDTCSVEEHYFPDSANRQLFSVVPFTFAVPIFLKYVDDSLGPDAAGTAEVEEGTFIRTMNIRLKSVRSSQEPSPEKSVEEVVQEISEVGKETDGKGTPRTTARSQSSPNAGQRKKNKSKGTPEKKGGPQSSSHAEHGKKNVRSTPPKAGGSQKVGDSQKTNESKESDDLEDVHQAQPFEGLSSVAISPLTTLASLGHVTQADLEQVHDDFVINCSLAEVKVLLHSYAEGFQGDMGDGKLSTVSKVLLGLDTPQLQDIGFRFYTGHHHPGFDRFKSDLPGLVETLAHAGQSPGGSYTSLVEDMCKHFEGARVLAAGVTGLGDEAKTIHLKNLGFVTLKFTIAACRLLEFLLRDTP